MKNLIKKYGISEKEFKEGVDIVAKNLGLICDVNVMLAVTELLAEGDIQKPKCSCMELEQILKDALKDYRGNNKVVVSTSRGGIIEIEDYDADPLMLENEELEEELLELEQTIQSLEARIRELEED